MRRGFVKGVCAFGLVAATGFAAYARFGMGLSWPDVLRAWLLLLGALTLAPMGVSLFSPLSWAWRIGRLEERDRRASKRRDDRGVTSRSGGSRNA